MTTDVINGGLMELRALVEQFNSLDVDEYQGWVCRLYDHLIDFLATAQPAADGEREAFEAYCQTIGYTLKTGDSGHYLGGYGAEIWAGWQARAAQPQQAVAVTDEVREHACDARSILRDMIAGIEARGNYSKESTLLFLNQALGSLDYALAAHKTGEEE